MFIRYYLHRHSQLNSNPSGNLQLLGQTNVGTVSDFLTVCLFRKGPGSDDLNKEHGVCLTSDPILTILHRVH